jgi:uncharacterized membrane protein YhhN
MYLTPLIIGLSLAALAGGVGAILSAYRAKAHLPFYILKPLTTLLIFVVVAVSAGGSVIGRGGLVAVALMFSLAGDILLMLPPRYFAGGILCFAVTHILYFLAFISVSGIALVHPGTPLLSLIAIALVALIWRGVPPSLRIPVALYTFLITVMVVQALGSASARGSPAMMVAAAGALLFYASDAMLAIDRFRSPFVAARAVVLSAYWLGQWLIAVSVTVW